MKAWWSRRWKNNSGYLTMDPRKIKCGHGSIMAGAEARAVWQRTANRYFVQEDAKRAPKLACCQSSSATSKQVDVGPASEAEETDHAPTSFMPFNRNPSLCNINPHTKWWLHLQPEYGYEKDLTHEQINDSEHTLDKFSSSWESILSDLNELELQKEVNTVCCDSEKDRTSSTVRYGMNAINEGLDIRKVEAYGKNNDTHTERSYKSVEMDPIDYAVFEKSDGFAPNPESPWLKSNRTEPWWRTSDRDELAFLVLQKSLDHVENCDLPPPRKHVCVRQYNITGNDKRMTSFDSEIRFGRSMVLPTYAQSCSDCETTCIKPAVPADEGHLHSPSDMSSREFKETEAVSGDNLGKDQLLEALCHSQTRAREAEEAAKKAYAEKEDIIKLLFKQASQLFAYKQWLQLLQLETAYIHMKNNDRLLTRKRCRKNSKAKRGKRVRPRNDLTTYAVAFALGLSLVGAGLLLGWTVGWMLPSL